MILRSLVGYYERKCKYERECKNDSQNRSIPPEGFEYKEIPFILVLDKRGNIVNIENTYEGEGKNKRAKKFLVRRSIKKTSGIASNLLWENPEYALGIPLRNGAEKVSKMHRKFIEKIDSLGEIEDDGLKAIKLFLKSDILSVLEEKSKTDDEFAKKFEQLKNEKSANLTFKLQGEDDIISKSDAVISVIKAQLTESGQKEICLINGKKDSIARLHSPIKGVFGCQPSGGNIVSFQQNSGYDSYGKKQGGNAPCGEKAVFAYTTALNTLLGKDSEQKMRIGGDTTAVFWASEKSKLESNFAAFFKIPSEDDPDRGARAVSDLFESIKNGVNNIEDGDKEFYVLGLSPNAGRISVRFFIKNTIAEMSKNIAQYFKDLEIVKPSYEKEFLPLHYLLKSTAVLSKSDNILPSLEGNFMNAVLKGLHYPAILLQAVINRVKAEGEVNYPRAALIKSYLNRLARHENKKEEIAVGLSVNNDNSGYVLGRLFAVLEKLQEEAQGETNSTIIRYYGSASSTPAAVFATLIRLSKHHLDKLGRDKGKKGRVVNFDKLFSEIHGKINGKTGYPSYLTLPDQGRFSIGYYQQRQDFFTKKEENVNE